MTFNDNQRSVYNGNKIKVEIFGASHAPEIGVIVDGLGEFSLNLEKLDGFMQRRRAKKTAYSTKRLEGDKIIFESGIDGNFLNGQTLKAVIKNSEQKSSDYQNTVKIPRPAHADFVAWSKYGDGFDYRGGGKFSGRMTAPMCIVGGICKQILESKGIEIHAFISSIGKVDGKTYSDIENFELLKNLPEEFPVLDGTDKEKMLSEIEEARGQGDSVGGKIDCVITGLPVGVGEYMFDSIESVISRLAFAVPAVKGIEFGKGFELSKMKGSQANDGFYYYGDSVKTYTNNNGGINGGISNGMPITFRVGIKPTPSISIEQDTVDLVNKTNVKLKIAGRHDSCIVPRAVPVIEAIAAIALYDIV